MSGREKVTEYTALHFAFPVTQINARLVNSASLGMDSILLHFDRFCLTFSLSLFSSGGLSDSQRQHSFSKMLLRSKAELNGSGGLPETRSRQGQQMLTLLKSIRGQLAETQHMNAVV